MSEITKEQLLDTVRDLAKKAGQDFILRNDFKKQTGFSDYQVLKYWDSWTDFFLAAGLRPQVTTQIDESDLLDSALQVSLKNEGIPPSVRFFRLCPYSKKTYYRRWGSYAGFLAAFKEWIESKDPSFPYLNDLTDSAPDTDQEFPLIQNEARVVGKSWTPKGNRNYGSFLNFRGLQHAPINEQGVVFLFGMVAFELGYVVESIATGFPDCEAKRRVKISKDTWERVRIEFEFQSRNFLDHGHRPDECDVIVCWTNNWLDSPIEVLELSLAIQELEDDV